MLATRWWTVFSILGARGLDGVECVAFVARCAVNRALKSRRGRCEGHGSEGARREEATMDPSNDVPARVRAKVEELPEEERLAVDLHY